MSIPKQKKRLSLCGRQSLFYQCRSVDRHIELKSHDLAKCVLGELGIANLENADLLVRNCGAVVVVNVLLQMCLDIGDVVLLDILVIGIDLGNDCVVLHTSLALTLVNDDVDDTGSCNELVFNLLGVNVLTVGEDDEVLFTSGCTKYPF